MRSLARSPWTPYVLMLVSAWPLGARMVASDNLGVDGTGILAFMVAAPYAAVVGAALLLLGRLPERHRWVARAVAWLALVSWLVGAAVLLVVA